MRRLNSVGPEPVLEWDAWRLGTRLERVRARTKAEARAAVKRALGLARLPAGTVVARAEAAA